MIRKEESEKLQLVEKFEDLKPVGDGAEVLSRFNDSREGQSLMTANCRKPLHLLIEKMEYGKLYIYEA